MNVERMPKIPSEKDWDGPKIQFTVGRPILRWGYTREAQLIRLRVI
jgi:hypothetical protein